MNNPLLSVIIPTKNSFPHIKNAILAVREQTYKNFELIIQDGASTDGTLEYLYSIKDLPISIISEPDSGIGQAYNRGIARSQGEFLCLAASDERLLKHSLTMGISWYKRYPHAASIYGSMIIINKEGHEISRFHPPPFDFMKFMSCECFSSTAGLLNRKVIGEDLFYDESLTTCPDYDFWLRLGSLFSKDQIIHRPEIFSVALGDETSTTYCPKFYQKFAMDKFFIIERFLSERGDEVIEKLLTIKKEQPTKTFIGLQEFYNNYFFLLDKKESILKTLETTAKAGILSWLGRLTLNVEGHSPRAIKYFEKSASMNTTIDKPHDELVPIRALKRFKTLGASVDRRKSSTMIQGGREPWGYCIKTALKFRFSPKPGYIYWFKIRMKVHFGSIGICLMHRKEIEREKIFMDSKNEVTVYYPLHSKNDPTIHSLIVRNAGVANSEVEIFEISLLQEKQNSNCWR